MYGKAARAPIDPASALRVFLGCSCLWQVFLRAGQMAVLDRQRQDKLGHASTIIQRHMRGYLARLRYQQGLAAVRRLQAGARGMLARKEARFRRQTKAATVVQSAWRRHKLQQEFKAVLQSITLVQVRGDAGVRAACGI